MKKLVLLPVFLLAFGSVLAQSASKFAKDYAYGKSLLEMQNFTAASQVFKSIAVEHPNNNRAEYAYFFYAFSAYKAGNNKEAAQVLATLIEKYPRWKKIDEAKYLKGVVHFDLDQPDEALASLSGIRNTAFEVQAYTLKKGKISEKYTADQVGFLYQNYSDDLALAEILFAKQLKMPEEQQDEKLLIELAQKFGFKDKRVRVPKKSIKKAVYNVAVLLPFLEEKTPENAPRPNLVYDLYEGMQLASQWLQEDGIDIKVHAFDTKRDSLSTARILEDEEMQKMDLILGPLYPSTVPLVSAFAFEQQIPMVNPFSTNPLVIKENPFAFLLFSSTKTQTKIIADFAMDSLESKVAYIISGNSPREKETAENYRAQIEEKGGVVQIFEQFDYSKKGYDNLVSGFEPLLEDSTGHVFASTTDQIAAVNVVSALQKLQVEAPIFALHEWLDFSQLTFSQLEEANVHISNPYHVDFQADTLDQFTKRYIQKAEVIPSKFAQSGFEAMYFFGKKLYEHGTGFADGVNLDAPEEGMLFIWNNYNGGTDNQYTPLLKFEDGKLIIVNPPEGKETTPKEED